MVTWEGIFRWVEIETPNPIMHLLPPSWHSVIAWQACTASGGYLSATSIQGLVVLNYPSYGYQHWHGTLIIFAVMTAALVFNSLLARHLPKIENAILVLHITGFLIVLISVAALEPVKSSTSEVFTDLINGGNCETMGLSFFVGPDTTAYAFLGADCAIKICEEIRNASTVVPWALMGSFVERLCDCLEYHGDVL